MLIHLVFGHSPHKLDTQRIRECQSENISPEKIKRGVEKRNGIEQMAPLIIQLVENQS